MIIKIGKSTFNADAVLKMGKAKFEQLHKHLDNAAEVYAEIEEKVGKKKPKDEK